MVKFRNVAAGICLVALSGMVYADDRVAIPELPTDASFYTQNMNPHTLLLVANEADAVQGQAGVSPVIPAAKFEPPWMSGRKAHEYLGLGTIVFAGLTAMTAPSSCENSNCNSNQPRQTSGTAHSRLARTTAVMAAATVLTGLLYHWDDFHLGDGWKDPDNEHVMLAGAGALLMIYAVDKSMHSSVPTSHAGIAEVGAAMMTAAIAIEVNW